MLVSKKNIIRILLIIGIVLYIIFEVIFPATESFSKIKKMKLTQIPSEYISLFNKKFRDSIYHNSTISVLDSLSYPVTTVNYNGRDIAIFKFNSLSKLEKIFKIKNNNKNIITPPYPNVPIKIKHTDFRYSVNIKKKIDYIFISTKKTIDTLVLNDSLFIGKGILKSLSFKFSRTDKSNIIVVQNNSYFAKEYNLVILKKSKYFYILFFSPSYKIMTIEDFYIFLNFRCPPPAPLIEVKTIIVRLLCECPLTSHSLLLPSLLLVSAKKNMLLPQVANFR